MKYKNILPSEQKESWLFELGRGITPNLEGLIRVDSFDKVNSSPEEIIILEKAQTYGAHYVFFETGRNGHTPTPQAFIFIASEEDNDIDFAKLHQRLWSWGGVPLIYRASYGCIQLFRCAHEPDFVAPDGSPICNPVRTLHVGAQISHDLWWDAARIQNGTVWDDPEANKLLLSAQKSAHRKLVDEVKNLSDMLTKRQLLSSSLRRRLLILSLLIAYLEEREVLLPEDFNNALIGATRFFDVLQNSSSLISLLQVLESRFNGHVFSLSDEERTLLLQSNSELQLYAQLIDGYKDASGQLNFWRLYSFKDLPIELISNIYQLFVTDTASSIYTPSALVRLMLGEVLNWKRLDNLMAGNGAILDPSCGSGIFLVESYKRLVTHWRSRNNWQRPNVDILRELLSRIHGVDLEEGAIELAAFSLCLSLCDALEPKEIRASIKLFPSLPGNTLHKSCFFKAKQLELIKSPIEIIVGNPPFIAKLSTESAVESYKNYTKTYGKLGDKQLAYLFLNDAMELLVEGGVLAMIEPSGFIYNKNADMFRNNFFSRWKVREILDFVSVRGIFKKGDADPKIIVAIVEATKPDIKNDKLLHAVFRRNGRATAEQGFDIDYYDLNWVKTQDILNSHYIWRANLLGGGRIVSLIERLRSYPTLSEYVKKQDWDIGEGYIAGSNSKIKPTDHLIGKPLMPTQALTKDKIDESLFEVVPNTTIESPRSASRFTPPLLLIKEDENLTNALWQGHYLTYKHRIVGISVPENDIEKLKIIKNWIDRENIVLRAYIAGISPSLYTQRSTVIIANDIYELPFPEDGDLDVNYNEHILCNDIIEYQSDFIRLGTNSRLMKEVTSEQLDCFDYIFTNQINAVYSRNPLQILEMQHWSGATCKAYSFGIGYVDWSSASQLHEKIDTLLRERKNSSLCITRIARIYDQNFIFLLKPSNHRFWTQSIALRDADDVLADLREQGF